MLRRINHLQEQNQIHKPIIRNPREVCLTNSQNRNTFFKDYFPQILIQSMQNFLILHLNLVIYGHFFTNLIVVPDRLVTLVEL